MLVRTAGFPAIKRLEDYDAGFAGANKKQLTELASLSFIERDGRFMVHDVNLRLGATVEGSLRAGFDIPGRCVAAALGRPSPPLPPLAPTRYVRFDGEVKGLLGAARGRGGESASTLARWIGSGLVSRRTVLDPSPFDPSWVLGLAWRKAQHLGSRARARVG